MLARAPRPCSRHPLIVVRRRPWRRLVAVVRGLARRGLREWEIASRLKITPSRVRLAQSEGAGIWTPEEMARMRAAMMEAGR